MWTTFLTVTEDEFFVPGLKGMVRNIALLLGIPGERIAVAGYANYDDAVEAADGRAGPAMPDLVGLVWLVW